jgi:hypothetical protein
LGQAWITTVVRNEEHQAIVNPARMPPQSLQPERQIFLKNCHRVIRLDHGSEELHCLMDEDSIEYILHPVLYVLTNSTGMARLIDGSWDELLAHASAVIRTYSISGCHQGRWGLFMPEEPLACRGTERKGKRFIQSLSQP